MVLSTSEVGRGEGNRGRGGGAEEHERVLLVSKPSWNLVKTNRDRLEQGRAQQESGGDSGYKGMPQCCQTRLREV